jgi:hypothetical protein
LLKDAGKSNLKVKIITYPNPRPYNSVGGQLDVVFILDVLSVQRFAVKKNPSLRT